MYKMPEFTETDKDAVFAFLKKHEFVTLTGNANNRSVATQVPVLIGKEDGNIVLRGHIMRKTDHHLAFERNPDILVLFTGAHCYVSSGWYDERNIGSTWNYMTVHLRGKIEWLDETGTLDIIRELTQQYEEAQANPELLEHLDAGYVNKMVKAIAGFEIIAEEIIPIFKLSQNRSNVSYKNIIAELEATGDYNSMEIAKEMGKRRNIIS